MIVASGCIFFSSSTVPVNLSFLYKVYVNLKGHYLILDLTFGAVIFLGTTPKLYSSFTPGSVINPVILGTPYAMLGNESGTATYKARTLILVHSL